MSFLEGHLLVSSPSLGDPNFFQSVVLLVRHNEEGALGLVLNRVTGTRVAEVWSQMSDVECASREIIRAGGPIQGPLMALHRNIELVDIEALPGVYFTATREKLEALVSGAEPSAIFFVGYAGWGAGQLEAELAAGAWRTIAGSRDRVFRDLDKFWESLANEIHGAGLLSSLGIKHVPADPSLN